MKNVLIATLCTFAIGSSAMANTLVEKFAVLAVGYQLNQTLADQPNIEAVHVHLYVPMDETAGMYCFGAVDTSDDVDLALLSDKINCREIEGFTGKNGIFIQQLKYGPLEES